MYTKANSKKSNKIIQAEVNQLWNDLKKSKNGPVDEEKYAFEINKFKSHINKREESQKVNSEFSEKKRSHQYSKKCNRKGCGGRCS